MRLLSFTLERYGPFTDRRLDFRPDARLHIVLGPNEAGKSSSLRALSDLFFGIDRQSLLIPPQEARDLALSATLRNRAGATLAFRRRRYKPALTALDGTPLQDDALVPFLGGLTRDLFRRAFGLDAAALRASATELRDTNGELGAALFSAASGLRGVRDLKAALEQEADTIFAPRASKERRFYQAHAAYEDARKRQRAAALTADRLKKLNDDIAEAEAAAEAARAARDDLRRQQDHLQRLTRARPVLLALDALEADLVPLAGLPAAGEHIAAAGTGVLAAFTAADEAATRAAARLDTLRHAREQIVPDVALLARADEIERLEREVGAWANARQELPRANAEVAGFDAALADLARRLGLPDRAALAARRPTDAARARLQALVTDGRDLALHHRAAEDALAEARREAEALAAGPAAGLTDTVAARERLEALAPLLARAAETEANAAELDGDARELGERAGRLIPAVSDLDMLAARPLPSREAIAHAERERRAAEDRDRDLARRAADLDRQTAELDARRAALSRDGGLATPERIAGARAARDALWSILRTRPFPPEAHEAAGLAAAIAAADRLADDALADAARLAEHAALEDRREALAAAREALTYDRSAAAEGAATLAAGWSALWAPLGVDPLPPSAMRDWLQGVEALLERRGQVRRRQEAAAAARREAAAIAPELAALAAELGLTPMPDLPPLLVARRIEAEVRRQDEVRAAGRERAALAADAARRLERAGQDCADFATRRTVWQDDFAAAAAPLGLDPAAGPDAAAAALVAWAELPALIERHAEADRRVADMRRKSDAFAGSVATLADALGVGAGAAPDQTFGLLSARLKEARDAAVQAGAADRAIAEAEAAWREAATGRIRADDARLALAARLDADPAELAALVPRLAVRDGLLDALAAGRAELARLADGHAEADLRAALDGLDAARLDFRLTGIAEEYRQQERIVEVAVTAAAGSRSERERHATGLDAEHAQQQRRDAEADLVEAARDWTVLALAARMLGAALERQRSGRQEPMMRAAGTMFGRLTGAAFAGLGQGFDEDDRPRLVALRADGRELAVEHMSEGTRDQLFLALRLAYLVDFATRAEAAPFIGDDLFASFDDLRTRHGLETLAALGDSLQPILFTHHAHVAEIARQALGDAADIITL